MYLKSLTVENYRKFRNYENILKIVHQNSEETNSSVVENTTLIVGRNNTGKTTLIDLLKKLSTMKAGSTSFGVHDFNLNYLQNWFEKNIVGDGLEENTPLPIIRFQLEIGVDDLDNNSLVNFEDILILENVYPLDQESEISKLNEIHFIIDVEYKCQEHTKVIALMKKLKQEYENENILIKGAEDNEGMNTCTTLKDYVEYIKDRSPNAESKKSFKYIDYCNKKLFKKYLAIIDSAFYKLLFSPHESEDAAKNFSLADLLEVKVVSANNINGDNNLSTAYNKIIETFIHNMDDTDNEKKDLIELLDNMNYETKNLIDEYYTDELNEVIQQIESSKKLEMNLTSDITMKQILRNSIKYEYMEDDNFIPENQFGLGYTNLMIIIAELVEYIDLYKEENYTDKINIICIEEPETYMHPQMQEMFIENIEKAIHSLYQNKSIKNNDSKYKINYQLIISTHSSHILNSKIHSGNTFNNINYLSKSDGDRDKSSAAKIVPLSDDLITDYKHELVNTSITDENINLLHSLTFIKKHMRIETSSLLFADAVIIVEGPTEEAYLKYIISNDEKLNKYYITVLCISGAYGKVYYNLIDKLNIPCIIYTDIDYKRCKHSEDKDNLYQISQWPTTRDKGTFTGEKFTTNDTLKHFVSLFIEEEELIEYNQAKNPVVVAENFLKHSVSYKKDDRSNEYLRYPVGNFDVLTQGKVNNYYASSLEEAIILENYTSKQLNSLLEQLLPQIYKDTIGENLESNYSNLKENSFKFQSKIGTNNKKSKFMYQIVYEDIISQTDLSEYYSLSIPRYLEVGLEILAYKLNGEG